jgi:O-Antigen ligase
MIFNFCSIIGLLACLALPLLRPISALSLISFSSFLGTYAFGVDQGVMVQPGPVVAAAYCLWLGIQRLFGAPVDALPILTRRILWIFILYAVVVTVGAPYIFGSAIAVVRPGRVSEGITVAVPLELTSSSGAQLVYLLISVILVGKAIQVARQDGFRIGTIIRIQEAFAVVFASAVILEAILNIFGLQVDFFNSLMGDTLFDPRNDRYPLTDVIGLPIRRAQAIFLEPSFFSAYILGSWGAALVRVMTDPRMKRILMLLLVSTALALTFSTTAAVGAIVVAGVAVFAPFREFDESSIKQASRARVRRWITIALLVVVAILLVVALLSSDTLFDYLFGKLTDTEGFEQGNVSSGAERFYWNAVALQAFLDSYGLGIGAGATRASSFFLNIAASYGILGVGLLVWIMYFLIRYPYREAGISVGGDLRAAIVMFLGWMVGFFISVPDGMSLFYAWIQLGFILGVSLQRTHYVAERLHSIEDPG